MNYKVVINMTQQTANDLFDNGFYLYGFKAVRSTQARGGSPVVWFKVNNYGLETEITWQQNYEAFTTTKTIIPNGELKGLNSYNIDLGDTLYVNRSTGTGYVDPNQGIQGAVSINNLTDTKLTCGISQEINGTTSPMCAFPLFGNMLDVIAPIEKIVLMFSTLQVNTGTVIEQAYSQGIQIDLTGESEREVNFDINLGWSADGIWARKIPAADSLIPFLIEPSLSLSKRYVASLGHTHSLGHLDVCDKQVIVRGGSNYHVSFNNESIDMNGNLLDASVNCGNTVGEALEGLPDRFDCYAVAHYYEVSQKHGHILPASLPENPNHCLMYGISQKDANNLFSHVIQR